MIDTPKQIGRVVHARFVGTGTKKIMLIAHMDTVYLRGMLAQQPFRILDGNRAYGLGITDDKARNCADPAHARNVEDDEFPRLWRLLTVLINADEERVSSAGSRATIIIGSQARRSVFVRAIVGEFGQSRVGRPPVFPPRLSSSVKGRASHAGQAPEQGRNALYELAHQILQTRDLSDPATGVKMNWTIASAGTNRNVIPAIASATADVRVLRVSDYDAIEAKVRQRIRDQLHSRIRRSK